MSRYKQIFEQIDNCQPRCLLEIGTWNAVNAVKMINTAAKYTPKDDIVYYGFDLWEDLSDRQYHSEYLFPKRRATYKQARNTLQKTGIEYHLIRGNTLETLAGFVPKEPVDFVWIDGGHSLATIRSDWKNVQRFIHSKTVVLFDDYLKGKQDFGCYEVIDEILDTERFEVEILPIADKNAFGELNFIVKVTPYVVQ